MKGIVYVSVVVLVIGLSIAGCANPMKSPNSGNAGVNKSVVLKDANGVNLGYVVFAYSYGVEVYSSKRYFVELGWDGSFVDGDPYFTGPNGTGTIFITNTSPFFGAVVMVSGQPYVALSVDANGLAIPDASITGYQSEYWNNVLTNSTSSLSAGEIAYDLKAATLADIGMPSSIALPMQLVSQ